MFWFSIRPTSNSTYNIVHNWCNVLWHVMGPKPRPFPLKVVPKWPVMTDAVYFGPSWVLDPDTSLSRVAHNEMLQGESNVFWPVLGSNPGCWTTSNSTYNIVHNWCNVFWPVMGPIPRPFPLKGGPQRYIITDAVGFGPSWVLDPDTSLSRLAHNDML